MLPMISISLLKVKKCTAFWVGFAEHCGDSHTHMALDADTFKMSREVLSGPGLSRILIKG